MQASAPEPVSLSVRLALALLGLVWTVGVFLSLCSFDAADVAELVYPVSNPAHNWMGLVGARFAYRMQEAMGKPASYLCLTLALVWCTVAYFRNDYRGWLLRLIGTVFFLWSMSAWDAMVQLGFLRTEVFPPWGGVIGSFSVWILAKYFGTIGSFLVVASVSMSSFVLATDAAFVPLLTELWRGWKDRPREVPAAQRAAVRVETAPAAPAPVWEPIVRPGGSDAAGTVEEGAAPAGAGETDREQPKKKPDLPAPPAKPREPAGALNYQLPEPGLLGEIRQKTGRKESSVVGERASVLEASLRQFGIEARVVGVEEGPVITQYELELAAGVKVHRIMALSDDMAMALKATSVRIVAPIPGRSTVGIEVPSVERGVVRMRELVEWAGSGNMALPLFVGKDASGGPLVVDLVKMPHLLIAGATGSGKTVCVNALILSLLMTRDPRQAKLILIDPKMVELSVYRDVPHLVSPVVTDMKRASAVLDWAVREMDDRYDLFKRSGVRQLEGFNRMGADELRRRLSDGDEEVDVPTHLPYLVIVVDELADLMMTAASEVEHSIIRLAQKSRAVGIHIVLATQRPSVDVITGLIKANMPARIAFQVASKVDSRTILDQNGAEKLLGQGDMLFSLPGEAKVVRAQGTFVDDEEIRTVSDFVKRQGDPDYSADLLQWQDGVGEPGQVRDPLYEEAVRIVLGNQRGSVSLLQRQFAIGYTRAARLVDQMAQEGLVGQYKGSQAREVLVTLDDWEEAMRRRRR
jgi:S-DNA-T family DNA segregation ATPase FtsK/SpoIIIE